MSQAWGRILSLKQIINPLKQSFSSTVSERKNHFKYGTFMIPHPDKVAKGGEDAYFVNEKLISVADGVGGWASYGVDPGLYSKQFCRNIKMLFEKDLKKYLLDPKLLISDAHSYTKEIGSTTAVVITLQDFQPKLLTSYIGDSGYVIYRKDEKSNQIKTVFVSEEQQRAFNFPYQIGSEGDSPSKAIALEHEIQNDDLIVVGTDGLFDNIDENQILSLIKPFWENSNSIEPEIISEMIAKYAYKLSLQHNYNSPFAKKARKHFMNYMGGKSDDITVVVGQVKIIQNNNQ